MRLWLLFLRSRLAFSATSGFLLIAALWWLAGIWWSEYDDLAMIASVIVPLVIATIVGVTISSPFGELEHTQSRPLVGLRLGHMLGLLTVASLALLGATTTWHSDALVWQAVRNVCGLAGVSLLGACLLGRQWSWGVPLAFCLLAIFLTVAASGDPPGWAWVVQPSSWTTTLIALGLLAAGLALAARNGARDEYERDAA